MPTNPMNPGPPIVQPGKQPAERELENPGHSHPEREVDPDPFKRETDDDPVVP